MWNLEEYNPKFQEFIKMTHCNTNTDFEVQALKTNSSNEGKNSSVSQNQLYSYFCLLCGTSAIILDLPITSLPMRKDKSAYVILKNEVFIKSHLIKDKSLMINYTHGVEFHQRYKCAKCLVYIAYEAYDEKRNVDPLRLYVPKDQITDDPLKSEIVKELTNRREIQILPSSGKTTDTLKFKL